jgi:hypothetical protein
MNSLERVGRLLVAILDNVSLHIANKLKSYWDLFGEKGKRFIFSVLQSRIEPD